MGQEKETKLVKERYSHADDVRKQIRDKEQIKISERNAFFEEGIKMEAEAKERRARLESVKQKKLAQLRNAGVPAKYCAEVERRINAPQGLVYPYTARDGLCRASSMDFVSGVSGCVGGPNFFCDNHGLVGDEEELKKMLNDRPVAVAVDATPFQFYSSGILDCRSFHSLNHAVFAVGYNDGSDFTVRNSWGKSWGESGYVRVGMGGNPCGIADYPAYAITK